MAKAITKFICQQCGVESPKWMGKCPGCGEWNSMVETVVSTTRRDADSDADKRRLAPQKLSQIKSVTRARIKTGISEFDAVLGGGIVPGSVILVAGEPGVGKSTLMLQAAALLGGFYISGEESLEQIKVRAERLKIKTNNLFFLSETNLDVILSTLREESTITQRKINQTVVVDSVQTMETGDLTGMAGSVGQVKECANRLLKFGKSRGMPVFLIGHVTKAGAIAGPKVLEHMVDTVLYIEGERFGAARLLRATKNRFGATDEVGVFEMTDKGMEEVANPSKLFLRERVKKVPGSVVVATLEGTRPVLVEIQALVAPTTLAVPRRISQGIDFRRLQVISAVLAKQLKLPLGTFDIYVNVAGGIKVEEPGCDLGVALAIVSSFKNVPLDAKTVCFGELGLLGEIREVGQAAKRVKEARKLGLTMVISPEKFASVSQVAGRLFRTAK